MGALSHGIFGPHQTHGDGLPDAFRRQDLEPRREFPAPLLREVRRRQRRSRNASSAAAPFVQAIVN
jgi:hypothetical protein